jgi:hypothetical protein
MKFQICKLGSNEVRIVEAKSAYDAMKKTSGNMTTISKCPKLTAKYGVPVFSKGWKGRLFRQEYTVTPIIEANVPVIMMPIGW